jgi:hypothetical protein
MKRIIPALFALSIGFTPICYADYVQPNIQHDPFMFQHVVYQLNTDDDDEQLQALRNANNHIQTVGTGNMELQIVVFSGGISVLQSKDEKMQLAIDKLRQQGVKFAVCNNTLKAKKIDWHSLHGVKESDIVPAGVAELVFLQQRGFAYIRP